ncbi:type II toxin-antitoxin system PemK/MazF family toxin [Hoyosella subflava]|uniref:type II toxin-antitoxin system PemK/MazF family toxin n=1 Tax=Hoyosella subflava TaxID=639313 RepID=UPI0009FF8EAF|nr:type II toxin-antitoxin system PemK/MazF family toxin [Hoyosella subflava]
MGTGDRGWTVKVRRGEVHDVDFSTPGGAKDLTRSAIIVSNDRANRAAERLERGLVTVVPISGDVRRFDSFHVLIPAGDAGFPRDFKAHCDQVRSISVTRVGERTGTVPKRVLSEIERALRVHLDL